MTYIAIKTAHKMGIEIDVVHGVNIEHRDFPELQSDQLLQAVDSLVRPKEISGIIVIEAPGSFTAVRSAAVVANAIAVARGIPVVGAETIEWGIEKLKTGADAFPLAPHYDREPNITIKK